MANFLWGSAGQKMSPAQVAEQRKIAQALIAEGSDTSPVGHWTAALNRGLQGYLGGRQAYQAREAEAAGRAGYEAKKAGLANANTFGGADPVAAALSGGSGGGTFDGDIASGISETAAALGMDPVDLATIISYETAGTFDPTKAGPTTQWGQHRGLIQFGEPQAAEYGVDWNNPVGSQLGANGAIVNYFTKNGWQPGMGLLDAYSIVNAGAPGRYNASDANNGGAPGTVADKVNNQMAGHRQKAMNMFGGRAAPAQGGGMSNIAALLSDEWAPENERAVLQAQYDAALKQQDPAYQLGLEKAQLELNALRNPTNEYQERQGVGEMMGLQGDALQRFVLTGEVPAAAEGFTLGEGDIRYDANGNIIAQGGPKTPTPDEYQRYVQEAQAAGQPVLDRIAYSQAIKGKGFSMTMPDGTVVQMGGAQGQGPEFNDTGAFKLDTVLGDIDAILDSDLARITGPIQGAGGNMVDDLNLAQRLMAGEAGLTTIERIGNLQNKTWMAARDMLKGGGSITDYESKKAEGAMARLSRVKSEADMRSALMDLRDAIVEGKKKLDAAKGVPSADTPKAADESDEDFLKRMGL